MSEPELAYMTGTNEDFDLPRWHTQSIHDTLSSSAQAAQSAAQASYLYNQGPPPQAANRLPPIQQPPSNSRQPRINQLLDEDHQFGVNSSPYSATSLARSLSLGGAPNASSRGRRHHLQDDLEGAFHVEGDASQRQTPASLYPPSVAYHAQQGGGSGSGNPGGSAASSDPYQDAYFTGSNPHTPKRSQTQHESSSSRAPRSPQRAPQSNNFLDPYSPPQYNSSSTTNYPYSPTTEGRPFASGGGYSSQSHSRSQSQAKNEPMSPSLPPATYSPQPTGQPSLYTGPYPMDTTSPAPSSNNLSARHPRQTSISQPTTPLSFSHAHHSPAPGSTQYFAQEHQPMAVEPPPPKRRASGLRRIRDHRDLRPFVNPQPAGRRVDSSGMPLSVRAGH